MSLKIEPYLKIQDNQIKIQRQQISDILPVLEQNKKKRRGRPYSGGRKKTTYIKKVQKPTTGIINSYIKGYRTKIFLDKHKQQLLKQLQIQQNPTNIQVKIAQTFIKFAKLLKLNGINIENTYKHISTIKKYYNVYHKIPGLPQKRQQSQLYCNKHDRYYKNIESYRVHIKKCLFLKNPGIIKTLNKQEINKDKEKEKIIDQQIKKSKRQINIEQIKENVNEAQSLQQINIKFQEK